MIKGVQVCVKYIIKTNQKLKCVLFDVFIHKSKIQKKVQKKILCCILNALNKMAAAVLDNDNH